MRAIPWLQDEAGFIEQLGRGRRAEFRVALALLEEGLSVSVGRLMLRDGPAKRAEFKDQADVTVGTDVLEVKARGLAFTSPDDYPYPTAFVGALRRWKARTEPPYATVLVSEKTGAMLVVPTSTKHLWTVEQAYDTHRGFKETCFAIERQHLKSFEWLTKKLEERCRP